MENIQEGQNNTPQIDPSSPDKDETKQLPKFTLEELLEGVTPENIHPEISTGLVVGKEVW